MSFPSIPGIYPDEYFSFALWSIGHGLGCGNDSWVVIPDTKTDYRVRHVQSFAGSGWQTSQGSLPSATFAGIIERFEMISIPLVAEPQGAMCDGATSGFCFSRGGKYYPPEEWKPLARWFGETSRILDKLFVRTV